MSKMLQNIQANAFLGFTFSLVASYFGCLGYYSFFRIDITSFLSIEDLTMIYAKWIWLSAFIAAAAIFMLYFFIKNMEKEESWWDKTIGKTSLKRRALVVLPIILAVIVLALIYKKVADVLAKAMGAGFVLVIVVILISLFYSKSKKKSKLSDIAFNDWFIFLGGSYFIIFIIPFLGGAIAAKSVSPDKIFVKFDDDKILNSADSINLIYIGKTTNYFFINNTSTNSTTAYRMDKVKSLEIILSEK